MKNGTREIVATVVGLSSFAATISLGIPVILSGAAGVGIYFGIKYLTSIESSLPPDYQNIAATLEHLLATLEAEAKTIKDASIRQQIAQVSRAVSDILNRAKQSKSQLINVSDFLSICLNSTNTIIHKYNTMLDGDYESPALIEIKTKIDKLFTIVLKSLNKEYQHLLKGDILNVDAEIELLQKTLSTQE